MPDTLKERSEIDPQYQWDLTRLYKDDAAWEQTLAGLDKQVQAVAAFAGRLKDAQTIRDYLDASVTLSRTLSNLYCYASMRRSEDTRAEAAQSMYARISAAYAGAVAALSFAEPEILALPEETLQEIQKADCLKEYRFVLENLIRQKPHTLSAPEEKLLASFSEVMGAPADIADSLQDADLVFDSVKDGAGEEHQVTGSNYILLQTSSDRTLRENAFRSFYKTYRGHINTFAATYAGAVKAATAEAAARHYESSRAMSMAGENIPAEVYDNLVAAVRAHLPLMYRYVSLRKRLLGIKELHYYDVYAPLTGESNARYTYEQAKQMVLDAVAPLGEEYCAEVRRGFDARWVDVYPNKGKSGGAYSTGTYDSEPYIMTNFTGTLDSVSTLAHEMGHSMHSYYSNAAQPYPTADYSLFVAEVASTVNEVLVLMELMERHPEPQARRYLLGNLLDSFRTTVFRQTMFAEFERESHRMAEAGQALTGEALSAVYARLNALYHAPAIHQDELIALEWMRIPHFYRAFYVYKYATGFSAAMALAAGIRREGEAAVERYRKFLSAGSSVSPIEALRLAGVDMESPAPVNQALDEFSRMVDEFQGYLEGKQE